MGAGRQGRTAASRVSAADRASGADAPYGDPLRAHGVAMEGYFWRFTQAEAGVTAIVLAGLNRDRAGASWTTLGVAAHPLRAQRMLLLDGGDADPRRVGARTPGPGGAGCLFEGDDRRVRVDVPAVGVDVRLSALRRWPRGLRWPFGGSSLFQCLPGLTQYWHPWILGGRADGTVRLGGAEVRLEGAEVYAEKNWGREGFPEEWWWGQAQGFGAGAAVAWAGGQVRAGPLRTTVTALVVALPDGRIVRLGDPVVSPVRASVGDESWEYDGRGYGYEIRVRGGAPLPAAHVLPVPLPSQCRHAAGAIEHLAGTVEVVVRRRGRTIWSGRSALAGLEHGGLARAEAELRRRGAPAGASDAAPVDSPAGGGS